MRPLTGMRVLAFEQYGAGPFGTQHLADLGAEVIKIEAAGTGGDYLRGIGPYFVGGNTGDSDASLFFQALNRNKKSLTLDITRPEGREILMRLVKTADATADNLRGDVPDKLGLTYTHLKAVNPALVCAHCSAYGRQGPRRSVRYLRGLVLPTFDQHNPAPGNSGHRPCRAWAKPAHRNLAVSGALERPEPIDAGARRGLHLDRSLRGGNLDNPRARGRARHESSPWVQL